MKTVLGRRPWACIPEVDKILLNPNLYSLYIVSRDKCYIADLSPVATSLVKTDALVGCSITSCSLCCYAHLVSIRLA